MNTNQGDAPQHLYFARPWRDALVPQTNICDTLLHWATVMPDRPYLTELLADQGNPHTTTYGELAQHVRAAAAALRNVHDVRRGDRIAVMPRNSIDSVILLLATAYLGAEAVVLNPRDPEARVTEQIRMSEAGLVFAEGGAGRESIEIAEFAKAARQTAPLADPPNRHPFDTAFILFTTGSTASSKAVLLTHYNLLVNGTALARHHGLVDGRRFLGVLPISYANGLGLTIIANLIGGSQVYLLDRFDPLTYLSTLEAIQANVASLVPSMLTAAVLARRIPPLPALQYFISAAAPLRTSTAREVYDRLRMRVVQGYGLTETTNFSTTMPTDLSPSAYEEWMLGKDIPPVGIALFGNEVAVLDIDGRPLANGAEGEVCMRGHSIMAGYDRNPDANDEAFRDGWFHSGDIGYMTSLDAGEPDRRILTLTGRAKNIVKIGGAAVSLDEVDRALLSLPRIEDAVALGVEDTHLGERIVIQVVSREADASTTTATIREALSRVLAAGLPPTRIELVAEVHRTANGKALRRLARPETPPAIDEELDG
ncbi:MAG: acyl--CoA ligase [Hamadaea sp.]|uniref:class I adenylate-forming enzyme family protein n=1 Tax=Hamadaea sp. TaxID=2024425 RepID=UPI0018057E26|nr:class I adenylate-forming enzyme family protein [Hamadaea sp.]NUT19790.1 acyl--CoA ligase [Hamadaea sp.]